MTRLRQIRKRDGRLVPFRREKIADAIFRAARSVGGEDRFLSEELAGLVSIQLERRERRGAPTIEEVQDLVEKVLIETGHARTAKAYILYRERRAAARAARAALLGGARCMVGGDAGGEAGPFSKAALVEALIEADGIERHEAEDVVRVVEERLLQAPMARIPSDLPASLVKAEMFDRGRATRLGAPSIAGVERARIRSWLSSGPVGIRVTDPSAFSRVVGEAALEDYVLDEVLPVAAAEAHRVADLHAFDLGAPLALLATALPLQRLLERHLHGDLASRHAGPRAIASALGRILDRYRPFVARGFTLENVNVHLAPFLSHLEGEVLAEEVRQWLLLPSFGAFPDRGGRLDLELTLAAEVPAYLAREIPPPPAPPGRAYGAYGDVAREVARAIVREARELGRRREDASGPRLTLVVERDGPRDAAARALLREALRSAREAGEPLVVFEDGSGPLRGGRWWRRRAEETQDPLRFSDGDVTVATATALNLVAAALRTRSAGREAFAAEVERLALLAVEIAAARRDLLERAGEEPGRQLYALRRGPVPQVDLDGALHLVCPVGVEHAGRVLDPEGGAPGLGAEILARLQEVLSREGARVDLELAPAPAPGEEAARRFARLDAARFGEAAAWWSGATAPTYAHPDPRPGEARREPVGPLWRVPAFHRVRHRIPAEDRPPVDDLLAAVERAAEDASCVEYTVDPWPRRRIRRETEFR